MIKLKDRLVIENRIISDHEIFRSWPRASKIDLGGGGPPLHSAASRREHHPQTTDDRRQLPCSLWPRLRLWLWLLRFLQPYLK
jgi:hypothetical protein